jgi:hypothetical protein
MPCDGPWPPDRVAKFPAVDHRRAAAMKAVLFDLGGPLEENNRLRAGALELLEALTACPASRSRSCPISSCRPPPEQIPAIRWELTPHRRCPAYGPSSWSLSGGVGRQATHP